ncbi:MAG: (d)CMP kinase [Gammaproteobacteria bacterium]|jgi:CMP/dCMP kinase
MSIPILTIDGPSGSGKGTIAAAVADRLGWHILDSGALYRLAGYSADKKAINFNEIDKLVDNTLNMNVRFEQGAVLLNGVDVSREIRTETTGNLASKIAVIPEIRTALLQWQRDYVKSPGLVADGRDMGTVVFPQAEIKIFLDASAEVRAKRRYKQLIEKGLNANLADLVSEIQERDERDRNRSVAPLCAADDAVVIDSSDMTIPEVIKLVLDAVKSRQPDLNT